MAAALIATDHDPSPPPVADGHASATETGRAALRSRLPGDEQAARVAATFKLLGDPTRVKLLQALLEAGELCVCDLAAITDTGESTVSQALRPLRAAEVVAARRSGRQMFYRLRDEHVRMLLRVTGEHVRHEGHDHGSHRDGRRDPDEHRRDDHRHVAESEGQR